MVYSNRFVACVLLNGTPQKELANGVVPIPLGAEYSLRFRNKHNRRSVVKFTVDGENVSGGGYVVGAHASIDIHRHYDKDAKFKFVSLESPEAVDAGKNGPNDEGEKGVIEAKFYLEKEFNLPSWTYKPTEHHHHHWYNPPNPPMTWPPLTNPYPYPYTPQWTGTAHNSFGAVGGGGSTCGAFSCNSPGIPSVINFTVPPPALDIPPLVFPCLDSPKQNLQEGCTVEGGFSGQKFMPIHINLESDYVQVRLVLKGISSGPGTPSAGEYCTTCGARRRKADRFCSACGTKLVV
jgi:zinc-ribbon domain